MGKNSGWAGYDSTSVAPSKKELQGEKVSYKAEAVKVAGDPFGGYKKDTRAEVSGNDVRQIGQSKIVDLSNNTTSSMGNIMGKGKKDKD